MSTPPSSPTRAAWRQAVLDYVREHPDHPLKPRALARELGISSTDYTRFRSVLRALLDDGTLALGAGRTLRLPLQTGQVAGVFRAHPRGYGFVERPGHPPLFVEAGHTRGALDGDTVSARLVRTVGRGRGPRAEVVCVLQRAERRTVGILDRERGRWIVRPLGRDPQPPVFVDDPTGQGSRSGDLVVAQPDEHLLRPGTLHGRIIKRLGDPADARAWVRAAIARYGLPDRFPRAVLEAAQTAAGDFDPDALGEREDLRDLLTVTIDPPDARDFDDAISVEPLGHGRVRLGVHIADVAHFVPPGGPIDLEARRRGTSVYFPGHVVPMLPEPLSHDVCCLRPGLPRLTKSVFLTYDGAGRVAETRFANGVIQSAARLTYPQVTAVLDRRAGVGGTLGGAPPGAPQLGRPAGSPQETAPRLPRSTLAHGGSHGQADELAPAIVELLHTAADLAGRIRRRRLATGMISLSLPEVAFRLGPQGQVLDGGPADTGFSHTLIEMFMVEANEAVSRALTQAGLEHLRRVHPEPDPAAAEGLNLLGPVLGRWPTASLSRAAIRSLLDAARGQPAEQAVNYVVLRALAQAVYSPSPLGHFALASDDYCHFTSPIRRYPDLTMHRLFDALVAGQPARPRAVDKAVSPDDLTELGQAASAAERRAQHAERAAAASLFLLLMRDKVGTVFDGVVTGVLPFGAFVQLLPSLAEGLVRVSDFGRDDWLYDRPTGAFVGRRTRRTIHLGLSVRVRVAAVDLPRQELVLVPETTDAFGVCSPGEVSSAPDGRSRSRIKGGRGSRRAAACREARPPDQRPSPLDTSPAGRRGARQSSRRKKRGHQGP
ncbi:MAG: RNB domain-containing ribonuclease [Planctomycetota bacterium]